MVGWPHLHPQFSYLPLLESVSVTVGNSDGPAQLNAAIQFMALLSQAPNLVKLHWEGPAISAPWAQLTHLSWDPPADWDHYEHMFDKLVNLTHLRIHSSRERQANTFPRALYIIPQVTTFFSAGSTIILPFLSLPLLHTLVLEFPALWEDARNITSLLTHSQCTIRTLQVQAYSWEERVYSLLGDTPSVLKHPSIAPSLTYLLITSQDLDTFFIVLDIPSRNALTTELRLLRSVDRCFRIDDLPGISPDENTGVLAALIRVHFPVLEQLNLDCRKLGAENLEARTVITGATSFLLRRPKALRQEYESWWNSQDGAAFRTALSTGYYHNILPFEVSWGVIHGRTDPSYAGQNLFSNPRRLGYIFI
ncbi:hypothetical protein DFH09DRAFT_1106044 [Mycena vulgaris]|nr:hypothetical protein DFH09DRAFT_1106044 [Mycena vulgaris]